MITSLKSALMIIIGFYLVVMLIMYLFQRNFLYFARVPDSYHMEHNYVLQRGDITLRGWLLNGEEEHALMYYGGNAELIDSNIDWLSRAFPNHAIYLVNYRGYGGSEGEPTEAGLTSDALAVYDDIVDRHSTISLLGRSLGSGVATHVAARRKVHKAALLTPYDSILDIAKSQYPILPVGLLLKDTWLSWQNASQIDNEVLVIYGARDSLVPPHSTERLMQHFDNSLLRSLKVEDADHNNILGRHEAVATLIAFLGGVMEPGQQKSR